MMAARCTSAPALKQLWSELKATYGDRVSFLGIAGDSRHCPGGSGRSDHCRCDALDVGVGNDHQLAWDIAARVLNDRRARYIIHQARGRRAYWRGGSWFRSKGHHTHIHISIDHAHRNNANPWGFAESTPAPKGLQHDHLQPIKHFQATVGTHPDGIFGPKTCRAANRHAVHYDRGRYGRGKHELVRFLQEKLNQVVGADLVEDGLAGPITHHWIVQAQQQFGIGVDGWAGCETFKRLLGV